MFAELFFGKWIESFSRWKEKQEQKVEQSQKTTVTFEDVTYDIELKLE